MALTEKDKLIPLESQSNNPHIQPKRTGCRFTVIAVILIIIVTGTGLTIWFLTKNESDSDHLIDIQWFYDVALSEEIDATGLPHGILWKQLNLTEPKQGLFRKDFNSEWIYNGLSPDTIQAYNNLIAQCRFTYNFANTYQLIGEPIFYNVMYHGLNVILSEYYDNQYNGYFYEVQKYVNATYIVTDDTKHSYGMSFVIKALSKCYQVTLNDTILDKLTEVYWLLINNFTDFTEIGLYPVQNRNMTMVLSTNKNDDNMLHFFHSLGKLYDAFETAGDSMMMLEIQDRINKVFQFMMARRKWTNFTAAETNADHDVGYLVIPWRYDMNWTANEPMNVNIILGHNFEYALFMLQYLDMEIIDSNDENICNINNILNYCIDLGWNNTAGLIMGLPNTGDQYRWWVGIESIRTIAYVYYQYNHQRFRYLNYNRQEIRYILINALSGYQNVYYDDEYGGIYNDPFDGDMRKGRTTKVGYHVSESCYDVLRYAKFNH